MSEKKHRNGKRHPMDGTARPVARRHMIPVIRILNPFDPRQQERTELQWRAKKTLADYFPLVEREGVAVSVSGRVVPPEQFAVTYLDKTDNIVVCPIPAGGGSGKQILSIVALIAVAVMAPQLAMAMNGIGGLSTTVVSAAGVTSLSTTGMMVAAGISVAGSMLVNAIFAPPKPTAKAGDTSSSYGVDGAKNTSIEGIPVPVCYGKFRTGGNVLGMYTTTDGDDNQTLYMLISAGEGPVESISDIEINDNPLADYHDVEIQTRLGAANQAVIPWFDDSIRAINKGQKLTTDWFYSTTTAAVDKLRLDFTAPSGMCEIDTKSGDTHHHSVDLEIEYRKVGDTVWAPLPVKTDIASWNYATYRGNTWYGPTGHVVDDVAAIAYLDGSGAVFSNEDGTYASRWPTYEAGVTIHGQKRSTVRRSYTTDKLDPVNYEVRVRRVTPKATKDNILDDVYLADINEITLENISYPYTALVALKIKMTDQLSGVPTVTFMNGGKIVSTYDGSAWGVDASQNPAWVTWDILTNRRYGGAMPAARLDLVAFKEFADYCDQAGLTWNGPIETETNVWDACQMVLRVGHSQIVPSGTRYTVVTEKPSVPVMMFSVANMIEGSYKETWLNRADRANEIDVTFFDKTDKYKQRTVKVYDPAALAAGAPQRSSAVTLYGVDSYERAYREAQLQLNLNHYILKTINFGAPLEAIGCRVGDLIYVQTDLTDWAQAGRFDSGSTASVLKLDRAVTMEAGRSYKLLTLRDAVQRGTYTISNVIGNSVFLSGFTASSTSVKRLQAAGRDVGIDGTFDTGVIVQDSTGLAAGQQCSLWDTDVIEEYGVVNVPGSSASVTLQTPASSAPAQFAQWMFGEAEKVKKPFRVKAITGDTEYRRDITAIEYKEEVYDNARYGSNLPVALDPSTPIGPVSSLTVYEETYVAGTSLVSSVVASWAASVVGLYAGADVYVQRNDGPVELLVDAKSRTSAVIPATRGDKLTVRAVGYDVFGKRSQYEAAPVATYTVIGEASGLDVGKATGASFVWSGRDCKVSWRYNATTHSYEFGSEPADVGADAGALDPHFKDYEVRIYDQTGTTLRRTEYTTDNSYVYIYDKNFADGLARRVQIQIRQRDIFNNLGEPAILDAYNPAPAIVSMSAVPSFESAAITCTVSSDPDFAGMRAWVSMNAADLNGTPSDAFLAYSGVDTAFTLPGLNFNTTYYYKVAAVDAFGPTELVFSAMQSFKTTTLNVAAIADGVLADTKLLPALKTRIDLIDADAAVAGSVNARVKTVSDVVNDPVTGLAQANAKITSLEDVSATSASANAKTLYQLKAQVNDAVTGLPAATAAITALNDVSATSTSAAAKSLYQLTSRVNNIGGVTMEQKFTTQANAIDGLNGQYSLKIDSNGYIAGFGLSSTTSIAGTNTSEFIIYADKFAMIMPGYDGIKPFVVGAVGGVPRVVLSNALIGDASISSAMIGDAQVSSLKLAGEAVTVPVSVSCVKPAPGKGRDNYYVITEGYFSMTDPGILYALFTGAATFPTGDRHWSLKMRVNGVDQQVIGGAKFNDAPALSASCGVPAGVSHVEVLWFADNPQTQILTSTLFMIGTKK